MKVRVLGAIVSAGAMHCAALADEPPKCRIEQGPAPLVLATLRDAARAYGAQGKSLPFDRIEVNPDKPPTDPKTLVAYVVSDAPAAAVGSNGCSTRATTAGNAEPVDGLSVKGGCLALDVSPPQIRCSGDAVRIFGRGHREGKASPALLYVLAHEMAHLLQGRGGEYAGRVEPLKLNATRETKLKALRESCEPGTSRLEVEADAMALQVLASLLPAAPYREPVFSPQGSVLWAADQLHLAANDWRKLALERELMSQAKPHRSFIPTTLPMPKDRVEANARRFVCDVLTRKSGVVLYPGKAGSHPALEERMRKVAEALRPIAAGLPRTGATQEYQPVAKLQEQLGDIFTFMYRETGIYMESLQDAICMRVNGDKPTAGCP